MVGCASPRAARFGFTAGEVRDMTARFRAADRYDEMCEWYDGYRFGTTEVFNPCSVVNYFGRGVQCAALPGFDQRQLHPS